MNCPHCKEPFTLTASTVEQETLRMRLEFEGDMLEAETAAGFILQTVKTIQATARHMGGSRVHISLAAVELEPHVFSFSLLLAEARDSKKRPRKGAR